MTDSLQKECLGLVKHFTEIECTWSDLEKTLTQQLLYLLEKDLPALYNLLYRIDVNEQKVRGIFGGESEDIAKDLSHLIIERLEEKAKLRLRYKNK